MGLTRVAVTAVLCAAVLPARAAFAQSLADVARRTEAQRKVAAAVKVYTNDSLPAVEPLPTQTTTAEPPEPEPAVAPLKTAVTVAEDPATRDTNMQTAPPESRRHEEYWRKTLADVRTKIAKLNGDIAAQQAKLDQIAGQSPTAVREREVVSGTIERLQKIVALHAGGLEHRLSVARDSKAPEEWLK